MTSCHICSLCLVVRRLLGHLWERLSIAEIITQAVVTFVHLTGEIHKNEKTDFHFFISPIDAKSTGDRLQRCRHLYIPQIPRKGGMFANLKRPFRGLGALGSDPGGSQDI